MDKTAVFKVKEIGIVEEMTSPAPSGFKQTIDKQDTPFLHENQNDDSNQDNDSEQNSDSEKDGEED